MSEWRYDEQSGAFRRADGVQGAYGGTRKRKDDSQVGWWVIVACFVMGLWPVGLILLILKLAEPQKKKQSSFERSPAGTEETAGAARQEPKQESRVVKAAKTVTKSPRDTASTGKVLRVVGVVLMAVSALFLVSEAGDMIQGWGDWSAMFQFIGMLAGGGVMLGSGLAMQRRKNRVDRYIAVMGERDYITVAELTAVTGKKPKTVEKDLDYMISRNMLETGAFVDAGRGILFRSADAYQRFLKERTKKENLTPKEANEGYAGALRAIREANDRIPDPVFSEKLNHMELIAGKIFREVEAHPEKQKQASTFFDYYLPTTLKLLGTYTEFEEAGIEGENLRQAKARIESIMDNLLESFEKQLDELYRSEAMDVDADIRVMENMLERDLSSVERDFGLGGGAAAAQLPTDAK